MMRATTLPALNPDAPAICFSGGADVDVDAEVASGNSWTDVVVNSWGGLVVVVLPADDLALVVVVAAAVRGVDFGVVELDGGEERLVVVVVAVVVVVVSATVVGLVVTSVVEVEVSGPRICA